MGQELEDLKTQLAALVAKVNAGQPGGSGTQAAPQAHAAKFVYAARKMSKFDGARDRLEDWLQEARSTISNMGLKDKDASEFLITHLEGAAKRETRLLSEAERADPKEVLKLLETQFGERLTPSQLVSEFHGRKQHKGETLREFSHALLELLDRVCKAYEPEGPPFADKDKTLRDRFIDGVSDQSLHFTLFDRVERDGTVKFKAIRDYAFKISPEAGKQHAQSTVIESSKVPFQEASGLAELVKGQEILTKALELQQQQQESLAKRQEELYQLVTASLQTGRESAGRGQGGGFRCYYCNNLGHKKINCRKFKRDQAAANGNPAPGPSQGADQGNTAGSNVTTGNLTDDEQVPSVDLVEKTVGSRSVQPVLFAGVQLDSLMDTGSDITSLPYSVFKNHIESTGVKLVTTDKWLDLSAANGLEIPYEGLAVMDLEVDGIKIPSRGVIITRDLPGSAPARAPGVVGTNVLKFLPAYSSLLQKTADPRASFVRVGSNGVHLPQGSVCCINATFRPAESMQVVEPISCVEGVAVTPCLVSPHGGSTLRIANFSKRDVKLRPRTRIGVLTAVQEVNGSLQLQEESGKLRIISKMTGQKYSTPKLPDLDNFPGNLHQRQRIQHLLAEYADIFYQEGDVLGTTPTIQHHIATKDDTPVAQPHRRIPPHLWDELKDHLQDLVRKGVITESHSDYASPIVIVRKKSGAIRMCIDYRKLNEKVRRDVYPIPRVEESLEMMSGAKFFSTLDLTAAYNQVEVAPEDQHKTAFTTPMGLFEYKRMPFGLSNSPSTFSRLMGRVFRDDIMQILLVYLDDVLLHSSTIDEHIERLETVFSRLRSHGLKLEPTKCVLFRSEVKFLGHILTPDGVRTDPEKVAAIRDWPTPLTLRGLRQFTGLAAYYRRFVKHFAAIAKPLYRLIGDAAREGKKQKRLGDSWTMEHEQAFQRLKQCLSTAPTLGYPIFSLPFILETDASGKGLGAILSQKQGDQHKIIAYASRALKPSETNMTNFSSMKLETLALKWAVVDKWREYLLPSQFIVRTDNNPLTYLMSKKKLSATEQQWASALAAFDFKVEYKSGKMNTAADALSRQSERPWDVTDGTEVCEQMSTGTTIPLQLQGEIWREMDGTPRVQAQTCGIAATGLPSIPKERLQELQHRDPAISRLIALKSEYTMKPPLAQRRKESKEVQLLIQQWHKIQIQEDIYYRVVTAPSGSTCYQILLPALLRQEVLEGVHDQQGHQGIDRTLALVRSRCYWPRLDRDVREHINNCEPCLLAKPEKVKVPVGTIEAQRPLEVVAIDFTVLERSSSGFENLLVMTDVFSKWTVAIPCKDQKAETVARALIKEWFFKYGAPIRILSDQGRDFESKIVARLCTMYGITKSRTTPYHPSSNGQVERFNSSLHGLMRTLAPEAKRRWPEHVAELVFAYNTTPHASTGFSPFYIMFGRDPRLPVDVLLGIENSSPPIADISEYLAVHQQRLQDAYKLVQDKLQQSYERRKVYANKNAKDSPLYVGQRVFRKIRGHKARHKIQNIYSSEVFKVVDQLTDQDVYKIERADGAGEVKWVNRLELRPCPPVQQKQKEKPKRTARKNTLRRRPSTSDSSTQFMVVSHRSSVNNTPGDVTSGEHTDDSLTSAQESELDQTQLEFEDAQPDPADVTLFEDANSEPTDVSSSSEESEPEEPPRVVVRRTTRTNAGKHSNLYREPRSAIRK